jgi:hypothetical protein
MSVRSLFLERQKSGTVFVSILQIIPLVAELEGS